MKIEASFLPPVETTVSRLVLGCTMVGLILLVMTLAACVRWLQLRADIPELRQQILELRRQRTDFDAGNPELKAADELNDIRRRIRELNALAGGGRDVSELLYALENIMPSGTVLKSLYYKREADEVLLEVESADAAFLPVLERDNPFPRMTLIKQSKPERGALMLYEIRLSGGPDGSGGI